MNHSDSFSWRNGILHCEDVSLVDLAAQYGTPAYVYSRAGVLDRFQSYTNALAGIRHRVCFAVKANSNIALLNLLAARGAWFDIVSGGELFRVLAAGADPATVVYSGVGKTREEMRLALDHGIHSFNCESEAEVALLAEVACEAGRTAAIALRVNPDVDAITHPYISTGLKEHKFGIDIAEVEAVYERVRREPYLRAIGVSCHIGSQLLSTAPLLEAAGRVLELAKTLRARGFPIEHLDLGGGLGVPYRPEEQASTIREFVHRLKQRLAGAEIELMLEPGRSVVAEAGILLTSVLYEKQNGSKRFLIVDAGMNDLIRPALYQAHHEIVPVVTRHGVPKVVADIVGPVCETGDFFARNRQIAEVEPGGLLAIRTAGAYGFVLASNYNSRRRPCELIVDGDSIHVARQRESYEDLIRGEHI